MTGDVDPYEAALRAGPKFCVACGREVEVTAGGYANHHCRESAESARRSAHTRASEGFSRTPPLWERLRDGFRMLKEKENGR